MLNRSEILTAAWTAYRLARPAFFAAGDSTTRRTFLRGLFAKFLRKSWADAKVAAQRDAVAETARKLVEAQRRVTAAKAAAMPAGERSAAISHARDELTVLDYAPLGIHTAQRRADLHAQISMLAGA